uniref:Uncharacterized protein n=1 Tax=candidate division WOR-3 bacterium TaxID=2052148 RepID=A0A7C4TGG5_UNCW3
MKNLLKPLFLIAAFLIVPKISPAQEQVYVGVYLNQITSISLKDNQFTADFYIWFRWKDKNINPLESFDFSLSSYPLLNPLFL